MTYDEIQGEINACKQLLTNTDYQAIKHSEGAMSEEEFAPIRVKRQEWRDRINELETVQYKENMGEAYEAAEMPIEEGN